MALARVPVPSASGAPPWQVAVRADGTPAACPCPGWTYRGKCRHATIVIEERDRLMTAVGLMRALGLLPGNPT